MLFKIITIWSLQMFSEVPAKYAKYLQPWWWTTLKWYYGAYDPQWIEPLYDESYTVIVENEHLLNMSRELIMDVAVKERHFTDVQKLYSRDPSYKLGLITAGALDKYEKMVKIFKHYVHPSIYYINSYYKYEHRHATNAMIQAYQIMQGDYNELRVENRLFFSFIEQMQYEKSKTPLTDNSVVTPVMTMDQWKEMSKDEQDQKIEEFKQVFGEGVRRRAGPSLNFTTDGMQEEYKRGLRYKKWAEKWNGFDPKLEGVEIIEPLSNMGVNKSQFLNVNPF